MLPPKLEGPERRYKWSLWLDVEHPRETNKIADEEAWHECQFSVWMMFRSSQVASHCTSKTSTSVALSRRDHRRTSAFITGASAALTSPSAESTVQITSAAVISSPSAESTVQSSSQQQHNTTTSTPSPKAGIQKFTVITVSGMEKKVGRAALSDDYYY